jgi:hypothetical protein
VNEKKLYYKQSITKADRYSLQRRTAYLIKRSANAQGVQPTFINPYREDVLTHLGKTAYQYLENNLDCKDSIQGWGVSSSFNWARLERFGMTRDYKKSPHYGGSMAEPCDSCGRKTDERSLSPIGNAYVCAACAHGYTEEELLEKLNQEEEDATVPNKKIYLVVTIATGILDDDCDQFQNMIGTYEKKEDAERLAQAITDHEPLKDFDYETLCEYDSAIVLELPLNGYINCKE